MNEAELRCRRFHITAGGEWLLNDDDDDDTDGEW